MVVPSSTAPSPFKGLLLSAVAVLIPVVCLLVLTPPPGFSNNLFVFVSSVSFVVFLWNSIEMVLISIRRSESSYSSLFQDVLGFQTILEFLTVFSVVVALSAFGYLLFNDLSSFFIPFFSLGD